MKIRYLSLSAAAVLLMAHCGGGGENQGNGPVLPNASQSSAIALSSDDSILVTVNENSDSISVFNAGVEPPALKKELKVGDEPVAVVIGPDNDTAFVANQADGTVSKISGLKGDPKVAATAEVGSEPVGLALSPSGKSLFVAELSQGRVSKIDTASMKEVASTKVPNPFGIAVGNNLDNNDDDETVVVSQFYGTPQNTETQDNSRKGVVHLFRVSDLGAKGKVEFQPRDTGVTAKINNADVPITASPNQLYSVTIHGDKFFVPSISASPAGPVNVRGGNLHPIIFAGSISQQAELPELSVNLEEKIVDLIPAEGNRNFLSGIVGLGIAAAESNDTKLVMYAASRGGDAVQRVMYDLAANTVSIDDFNKDNKPDQIDLFPKCRTPMGVVVARSVPKAYANCRGTRQLVSMDMGTQTVLNQVQSSTPPAAGSEEAEVEKGQLLFFTARARWSTESRSDCAACHANGNLSDNIVWSFPAGPRRTVPMHWTYQDRDGDGKKELQRILNWSGIFDEIRDFEANITNVSGGKGVLTPAKDGDVGANCASLATQDPSLLDGNKNGVINADDVPFLIDPNNIFTDGKNDIGLSGAVVELENNNEELLCAAKDWDEVDAYAKTLRSPNGPKTFGNQDLEASIQRGRNLFTSGGCVKCHGGPGWTASELFYDVTRTKTQQLAIEEFDNQALINAFGVGTGNLKHIQNENGFANPPGVGPLQVACVTRNVGTFGNPNLISLNIEIKNGDPAQKAQGEFNGYNVPNLLGIGLNAPFFHHGQAKDLNELLTSPTWATHLKRANGNFALAGQQVEDMKNFLLSIDEKTPAFSFSQVVDVCD